MEAMGHSGEPAEMARTAEAVRVRPRWLPFAMLVVGAGGLGAGGLLAIVDDPESLPWHASAAVMLAAAAWVYRRRPSDALSGWFCVLAGIVPTIFVSTDLIDLGVDSGWSGGSLAWLTFASGVLSTAALIPAVRLFGLFPDGVIRTRAERGLLRAAWTALAIPFVLLIFTPEVAWPEFIDGAAVSNPMHVGGLSIGSGAANTLLAVTNLVALAAGILLIIRYRRSDVADRRRIRWLLLPVLFMAFGVLADTIVTISEPVGAVYSLATTAVIGLAVAFGLAEPRRVDVDDVLRRSIVYGSLWLLIAGLYVGAAALLSTAISDRVPIGGVATVTVLIAIALQPIRGWLGRLANRRVFGASPDPRRAIAQLGSSLEGTVELDMLLPQMETALVTGLGVSWARVRLLPGEPPDERNAALSVPITLDEELLGIVECGPKSKGALDDDDIALVTTLARQAALAVRNLKLTTQLTNRTAELTASRARLVRAEEAERRRIERNIHDGVQQELVALIGQSGILRRRLNRDGSIDAAELDKLQSGLQQVLAELRDLATGIHPSLLRDRGLLPAVEALAARHPIPVDVRADPDVRSVRLAAEVEGASYFTVAESLANSLKHADAGRVDVAISRTAQAMSIEITDDGRGFDVTGLNGHSHGLGNLTERVAAVGGRLQVASTPGTGTSVIATMPITGETPEASP